MSGTSHFLWQRLTAVANLFLVMFFVLVFLKGITSDYETATSLVSPWWAKLLLGLFLVNTVWHMFLGLDTIVTDYFGGQVLKIAFWANTGFCVLFLVLGILFLVLAR